MHLTPPPALAPFSAAPQTSGGGPGAGPLPGAEGGSLVVHYQPVVDLGRGEVVGAEALARWHHPELGLLLPNAFLPPAEHSGAIVPLGLSVLETACRQGAGWASQGLRLEIAVNLSLRQVLDPGLVADVRRILDESGLPASQLLLEIQEHALDHEDTGAVLHQLADRGVQLGLDDFGTGCSSLLYLKRFPIAALKVDSTFVAGLGVDRNDEAIVSSVANLAAALGGRCTAEGVETAQQHAQLLPLRCQAQGHLYASPVPASGLPAAVDRAEMALETRRPPVRSRSRKPSAALAADVGDRMLGMHVAGASRHTIAAALNESGASHPQGIRWHASSVAKYLHQAEALHRTGSTR